MSYRHHGMRQSYVNLESPGVVELDTSVVPDVLGLRALYENAEPTRVLPVRAQNSVRVLVPEARAMPMGFHDVTLVDLTGVSGLPVSMGEMGDLRRQWPTSLLTGMTRRQTDLELMRRECKRWFRNSPSGSSRGRINMHDMARYVSTFHLDQGHLWRCPVSWCSQWKGTAQDCIEHIRLRHLVGTSLKTANLGKWFPPWTVTRPAWYAVLKPNVSGIATDVVLFSEHGCGTTGQIGGQTW